MNSNNATNSQSVYRRGAHDGAMLGAYLSVMFIASSMSMISPLIGLVGTAMALFVPALIYIFLRRSMKADRGKSTFSALWMQGIVTFICGGAIMSLVMYVFMRFIKPDFIISQIYSLIYTYEQLNTPTSKALVDMLNQMIEENMVPSAISVASTTLWFAAFSGSILSMIIALIVRYVVPLKERHNPPTI